MPISDLCAHISNAKKAKFDEVEVPFRSKVNEEKGHEYSNFRNSTHKQNEGNRATSSLSQNDEGRLSMHTHSVCKQNTTRSGLFSVIH